MDIANHLEAVASSGEDFEEDAAERVPAPQRFMTAVQAAVQTAEALGMTPVDESPRLPAQTFPPVPCGSTYLQAWSREKAQCSILLVLHEKGCLAWKTA